MNSSPILIPSSTNSSPPSSPGSGSDEELLAIPTSPETQSIPRLEPNLPSADPPPLQSLFSRLDGLSSSFPPSTYRYVRYKHFGGYHQEQRKSYYRPWRKSAYCIAAVHIDDFVALGAQYVEDGFYALPRTYDGSPTGETCAILGLSARLTPQLLNPDSELYVKIKACPLFQTVPGLDLLSPYNLHPLRFTLRNLRMIREDELLLINLEPKGEGSKYEHQYPTANLCLPGGSMEYQDQFSWERTALREFSEEVGIELKPEQVSILARHKFNLGDRQAMYFWIRVYSMAVASPPYPTDLSEAERSAGLSPQSQDSINPENPPARIVLPPPGFSRPLFK